METIIRPSSDLRNLSRQCTPVNGRGDTTTGILSNEILHTLAEAENDVAAGRVAPVKDMFSTLCTSLKNAI